MGLVKILFKRRAWSKWEHVRYVERYGAGIPVYELLVRKCEKTGLTQYKRVRVYSSVYGLKTFLNEWRQKL